MEYNLTWQIHINTKLSKTCTRLSSVSFLTHNACVYIFKQMAGGPAPSKGLEYNQHHSVMKH